MGYLLFVGRARYNNLRNNSRRVARGCNQRPICVAGMTGQPYVALPPFGVDAPAHMSSRIWSTALGLLGSRWKRKAGRTRSSAARMAATRSGAMART